MIGKHKLFEKVIIPNAEGKEGCLAQNMAVNCGPWSERMSQGRLCSLKTWLTSTSAVTLTVGNSSLIWILPAERMNPKKETEDW